MPRKKVISLKQYEVFMEDFLVHKKYGELCLGEAFVEKFDIKDWIIIQMETESIKAFDSIVKSNYIEKSDIENVRELFRTSKQGQLKPVKSVSWKTANKKVNLELQGENNG